MENRIYLCIDLKSFYASVECVERGLDPMVTNLVVADNTRTEKTICLAVSPALKSYAFPGRLRLFEVIQKAKFINLERQRKNKHKSFVGESWNIEELAENPHLEFSYIVAPPRMALYMKYSAEIYKIYLKYVAPEDIHVYSIDEVFIDITNYLELYKKSSKQLTKMILKDIFVSTGITATAGIGTNMYLAKVALDIVAKRVLPDEDGARIAQLDEKTYRKKLWEHRPITDFWRVGKGYEKKLSRYCIDTMGAIAECSLSPYGEDLLYKLFGVNAELLIDHAWGWESCTISDIKNYKPKQKCIGSGQVLQQSYPYDKAKVVMREMAEQLSGDLFEKDVVTNQLAITIGYDIDNLKNAETMRNYSGGNHNRCLWQKNSKTCTWKH